MYSRTTFTSLCERNFPNRWWLWHLMLVLRQNCQSSKFLIIFYSTGNLLKIQSQAQSRRWRWPWVPGKELIDAVPAVQAASYNMMLISGSAIIHWRLCVPGLVDVLDRKYQYLVKSCRILWKYLKGNSFRCYHKYSAWSQTIWPISLYFTCNKYILCYCFTLTVKIVRKMYTSVD